MSLLTTCMTRIRLPRCFRHLQPSNPLSGPPTGPPWALFAGVALGVALAAACEVQVAKAPGRPLPAYAGHAVELFDDMIEPAAVGISLEVGPNPRSDRLLRERAQVGDATLRVRITTVTTKQEDSGTGYVLGLRTVEKYAGHFPPGETFEVSVGKLSPSAGLLKGMGGTLAGKTFTGFVRAFVRPDGDSELHFHLAPDSKAEISAVNEATALANL